MGVVGSLLGSVHSAENSGTQSRVLGRRCGCICMMGKSAVVWRRGFPGGSKVKNLPAVEETWVQSLGREDPLEEDGMATHSSILAWRIPWTEEPDGLQSIGSQRVRQN